MPETGGAITGATDAVPVLSTYTARGRTSDLFSSQPRPELGGEHCGHLPTSLVTVQPVGCTPLPVYSTCI
jgi:hypothetical protein